MIMILACGAWFAITSQWDEITWLWFPIKQSQLENHKEVRNCSCFHWFYFARLYSMVSAYSSTHPQHNKYPSKMPHFQTLTFCHMYSHTIFCIFFYFSLTSLDFSISLPPAMRKIRSNFINALGLLCIHCWNVCLSHFQQIEFWKQREGGRKDQLAYL